MLVLGACSDLPVPGAGAEPGDDDAVTPSPGAGSVSGSSGAASVKPSTTQDHDDAGAPTRIPVPGEDPDAAVPPVVGEEPDASVPPPVTETPDAGTDPDPPVVTPPVVVPPTVTPAPVGSVYADALAAGWNLNGWGWSTAAEEVASPAHGARSVHVSMNRSWCGFVLARMAEGAPDTFSGGTHDALDFDFYTGSTPDAVSALAVRLNNGNGDVRVRDYVQGTYTANTWLHAHVPFAALNPSRAPYHRVEWFNASDRTYDFYVDDVVLTPASQVVVTPVLLPASVSIGRTVSTGQNADRLQWLDAKGWPRSADFVDDAYRGGYIRALRYQTAPGTTREAHGGVDPSTGYQGFGYLVSHYDTGSNSGSDSADSRDGDYSATLKNNGHSALLWQGKHHAIRSYTVDLHPGYYGASGRGTVHATVHWLIASGRSPMTFSVTYDASPNAPGSIVADSRAPYGAIAWDGNDGKEMISGVSWGDRKRFVSQAAGNLSMKSDWTYNQANTVPFASAWTQSTDAEMGIVETRSFNHGVSGGDLGVWFDGQGRIHGSQRMDTRCWMHTSLDATNCADPNSDGAGAKMPVSWAWPFQLMNYGLGNGSNGKKIAWGTNYGAIGQGLVVSFGDRVYSGWPYTSYSTQVVLGAHSEGAVDSAVSHAEAALGTLVTAQVGLVRVLGAPGVGRSDVALFETPGLDPVYGAFSLIADLSGRSDFTLASGSRVLSHPLVTIDGARGGVRGVTLDGAPLQDGVDYYASVQDTRVWLTLLRDLSGTHSLRVDTDAT